MRCVNLQGTFCIVHEMQDKHNSAMIVKYFIIIKLFNVPSIIF